MLTVERTPKAPSKSNNAKDGGAKDSNGKSKGSNGKAKAKSKAKDRSKAKAKKSSKKKSDAMGAAGAAAAGSCVSAAPVTAAFGAAPHGEGGCAVASFAPYGGAAQDVGALKAVERAVKEWGYDKKVLALRKRLSGYHQLTDAAAAGLHVSKLAGIGPRAPPSASSAAMAGGGIAGCSGCE